MVVMVSSKVSSRFEKVEWPSNREDIAYQDRGQLGLSIFLYTGRSGASVAYRRTLRHHGAGLSAFLLSQFTELPRRGFLGNPYPRFCIDRTQERRILDALAPRSEAAIATYCG